MEKRTGRKTSQDDAYSGKILYGIEDIPPPPLCFVFGLQQAILTLGGPVAMAFVISRLLCAEGNLDVTSKLLSISLFMSGVGTIMQTMFGLRLGVIQSSANAFIPPMIAMMALSKWKCDGHSEDATVNNTQVNDDRWKDRMREIQGNIMLASLTQVVLGCTGLIGILLKFIGPLTVAPTLMLLSFSLKDVIIDLCKSHWGIAFMTAALIILFSIYIGHLEVPFPSWSRKQHCHVQKFALLQLITVILSICITWLFSYILTVTDVFPTNSTASSYQARTDIGTDVVAKAPWFYLPYPYQFGTPTVSVVGYAGFLIGTIASVIESIGDYYAVARISGVPPPPSHAVNRAVAMEGLASIISGLVGAGHGTTSYSGNIGAIGITKVASRAVFLTAGVILLLCGVVGKFGAVLSLIPLPIIGGSSSVPVAMISAAGISILKFTNLESTRNITILGTSLLLGLVIPQYINSPENVGSIKTGNENLDNMLNVLLGNPMFVGAVIGFLLDNTAPGSDEDRGILSWREVSSVGSNSSSSVYEFPYITKYIRRVKCFSYIPVSPTFNKEFDMERCNTYCCKKDNEHLKDKSMDTENNHETEVAMNTCTKM